MNQEQVTKHFGLLQRWQPKPGSRKERVGLADEYSAATEKLMAISDALPFTALSGETPEQLEEREKAFILVALHNAVRKERRDQKAQKRGTMNHVQQEIVRRCQISIPDGDARKKVWKKFTFEEFYAVWLGERGLNDSLPNREAAQDAFDKFGEIKMPVVLVSLEEPMYRDSETEHTVTLGETIPARIPSPEEVAIQNEKFEYLDCFRAIKNDRLRKYLLHFLVNGEHSYEELLQTYWVALYKIIANVPKWRTRPEVVGDFPTLLEAIEFPEKEKAALMKMEPAQAKQMLVKFKKLGWHVYNRQVKF
jgi:hypothetical protein